MSVSNSKLLDECPTVSEVSNPKQSNKPKLLQQVQQRHTEEAYVNWVKRFILFHNKRHPTEMGAEEIKQFLNHLAVNQKVAASTQNSPREIKKL